MKVDKILCILKYLLILEKLNIPEIVENLWKYKLININ